MSQEYADIIEQKTAELKRRLKPKKRKVQAHSKKYYAYKIASPKLKQELLPPMREKRVSEKKQRTIENPYWNHCPN